MNQQDRKVKEFCDVGNMWVVEPTLDKMIWKGPSAKMVKLIPAGQKAAGTVKSQVENVPGAWQRKYKGPKWKSGYGIS